jgi:hypothetical protein
MMNVIHVILKSAVGFWMVKKILQMIKKDVVGVSITLNMEKFTKF